MLITAAVYLIIRNNKDAVGSLLLVLLIVGGPILLILLLTKIYKSEKPFYNYLLKKMVGETEEKDSLSYEVMPKEYREVNRAGGFFVNGAVNIRAAVKNEEERFINFINLSVIISTGKSTTVYFNGNYSIMNYDGKEIFQIRSHSVPRLKGIKFEKTETDGYTIFWEEGSGMPKEKYLDLVKDLRERLFADKIYLGTNGYEIHFAYESKKKLKKPKELTIEYYNETATILSNFIKSSYDIMKTINN